MGLPKGLTEKFHEEITKYEEENKMPFITTAERIGIEKGLTIGENRGVIIGETRGLIGAIEDILDIKFVEGERFLTTESKRFSRLSS